MSGSGEPMPEAGSSANDVATRPDAGQGVADVDRPRAVHYVDLVLGAWRPREAAFQLAAGLGVALQPNPPTDAGTLIGPEAIDVAARGDMPVNQAWDDALRISAGLRGGGVIAVLAPRFGLPLRADNEWLFHFLRRLGRAVVILGDEPQMHAIEKSPFERRRSVVLPERDIDPDRVDPERLRLLRFFPGLLPRPIADAASLVDESFGLIPVGDDRFLVPTSYRDTDPRKAAFDFDLLEVFEDKDDGFKATAQYHCTNHFADSAVLVALARRCFACGARDIADDLVRRARAVAGDPAAVARAEIARHEMAIAERRFADVIGAPRLSPRAPAPDREEQQRLKDWAALAIGDLSGSAAFVNTALSRLGGETAVDPDDVMRLDHIVRARHSAGDIEGATTLARSVASALAHDGDTVDQRLVYANAMSLVRLYQARGYGVGLVREIDRAFTTMLGARCLSDVLLMNVLRAKSERDQTAPGAASCWLRAALLWLCLEPSGELSREAAEVLLGGKIVARATLANEISLALADALAASWPSIAQGEARRVPHFHPASAISAIPPRRMYAGNGAAVVWSTEVVPSPPPPSPRARLIQLACAALAEICPPFAKVDGGMTTIDINAGVDIPASRTEALSAALRLPVDEFHYGDERIWLKADERSRLAGDLEVRLSPIVAAVTDGDDGVTVSFKRYLPQLGLAGSEAQLVAALRGGKPHRLRTMQLFGEEQSPATVEATLRRLEAAHVVRLDLPKG